MTRRRLVKQVYCNSRENFMLLLLMRHGIAEPLADSSFQTPDDFHRALTGKGRKRARRAAWGLRKLTPRLDFLASSPKTRARQTAQIAREVWGKKSPPLTEWSELMENDGAATIEKLRAFNAKSPGAQTVLLCGHEPLLSRLISQLLSGSPDVLVTEMKKAGVCGLEISFEAQKTGASNARLLWHLTPRQLREIGKRNN